jgi:hypothetical protein
MDPIINFYYSGAVYRISSRLAEEGEDLTNR